MLGTLSVNGGFSIAEFYSCLNYISIYYLVYPHIPKWEAA
jgi:hypothetical protein